MPSRHHAARAPAYSYVRSSALREASAAQPMDATEQLSRAWASRANHEMPPAHLRKYLPYQPNPAFDADRSKLYMPHRPGAERHHGNHHYCEPIIRHTSPPRIHHPKPQRPAATARMVQLAQTSPALPKRAEKGWENPGLGRTPAMRRPRDADIARSKTRHRDGSNIYPLTTQRSFTLGRDDVLPRKNVQIGLASTRKEPKPCQMWTGHNPQGRFPVYEIDTQASVGATLNFTPDKRDSTGVVPRYNGCQGVRHVRKVVPAPAKSTSVPREDVQRQEDKWLRDALGSEQRTAPPARPHSRVTTKPSKAKKAADKARAKAVTARGSKLPGTFGKQFNLPGEMYPDPNLPTIRCDHSPNEFGYCRCMFQYGHVLQPRETDRGLETVMAPNRYRRPEPPTPWYKRLFRR